MRDDHQTRSGRASWADALEGSDHREVKPGERRPFVVAIPGKEPVFWSLFSAGGFVAAIVLPIHVAILGIAFAAGWLPDGALSYDRVLGLARQPLTKLYLWGVVSLPLYHWAHRFRFAIHHQFGIHGARRLIAVTCYGLAVAGTVVAGVVILRI
jgi:fumarate reductase subunit D